MAGRRYLGTSRISMSMAFGCAEGPDTMQSRRVTFSESRSLLMALIVRSRSPMSRSPRAKRPQVASGWQSDTSVKAQESQRAWLMIPGGKPASRKLQSVREGSIPDQVRVDLNPQSRLHGQVHEAFFIHHGRISHDGKSVAVVARGGVVQQFEVRSMGP